MAAEIVVIGVAVLAAYALFRFRRDTTESLFTTIQQARQVLFGIVGLIVALVLISSGYLPYMILGALAIGYGVLWVLFEEPHEEIREVLPV